MSRRAIAYVDEAWKTICTKTGHVGTKDIHDAYLAGYRQATQDAARLAADFVMSDGDHGTEIAEAIRALAGEGRSDPSAKREEGKHE